MSCVLCRLSRAPCDGQEPCRRCRDQGSAERCFYVKRRRGRPRQQRRVNTTGPHTVPLLPAQQPPLQPWQPSSSSSSSSSISPTGSPTSSNRRRSAAEAGFDSHAVWNGTPAPVFTSQAPSSASPSSSPSEMLSFLTKSMHELNAKINSLEEDNLRMRLKHRKAKRRLRETQARLDQLFEIVEGRSAPVPLSSSSSPSLLSCSQMRPRGPRTDHPQRSHSPPPPGGTAGWTSGQPQHSPLHTSSQLATTLQERMLFERSESSTIGHLHRPAFTSSNFNLTAQRDQHPSPRQQHQHQYRVHHSHQQPAPCINNLERVYSISSISDIRRHFPFLELDDYFLDRNNFVVEDLRKPYLVLHFVTTEARVVSASEAYCSLTGLSLYDICQTKKLVALLPIITKRYMMGVLMGRNDPKSTLTFFTPCQLLRKDGQLLLLEYHMQFFFEASGKAKWLIALVNTLVNVERPHLYTNFDSPLPLSEKEKIKLLRGKLRNQDKEEWVQLFTEAYATSASTKPGLPSASISNNLDHSPPLPLTPASSATSSSPPPASPLSSTSWLAEMFPPTLQF